MQIAKYKLQIAGVLVVAFFSSQFATAAFTFDDIEFWVGSGANRAAMVIDWDDSSQATPALAWGFRWDGEAFENDMLVAIVSADDRLFAKLAGPPDNPLAVYGLGYDADDDGEFGVDDGTSFDDAGIAFTGPSDLGMATDPGDSGTNGDPSGNPSDPGGNPGDPGGNPSDPGGSPVDSSGPSAVPIPLIVLAAIATLLLVLGAAGYFTRRSAGRREDEGPPT